MLMSWTYTLMTPEMEILHILRSCPGFQRNLQKWCNPIHTIPVVLSDLHLHHMLDQISSFICPNNLPLCTPPVQPFKNVLSSV